MATTTTKDFQTFKIYLKVARELQSLNPIVSYYLRTFALNKAVELLKIERAQGLDITQKTAEIKEWLQDLEGLKTMLGTELANKENCKQIFQNFTFDLYQKSDMEYRKGAYTRTLAKNFLYISVLFDAWEILGGQASDVKEQKNYANQARFKIMESIDNNKDNMNHIKPATTPNAETPGADGDTNETRRLSLDPLEKLDFGLTESIIVPQSTIDKFLDGTRPDVKIVATNVLNELAEKPKGGRIPPQNNNMNQVGAFKLPMGTSVRIEDNNQNGNNNMCNQNNQGNVAQFNTQGYQQHVPNTVYHPSVQQVPQMNAGYPVRSVFQGNNNVQSTFGQHVQHIPQNQQNQTVLKEIQNKTGAGNQVNQGNMEKEKGELMMRCQEAKDFCLKAASELDFVKVKEAKEKIYKALCLLEQLEKQQQCCRREENSRFLF